MAKNRLEETTTHKKSDVDNMMKELISSINKEYGTRIAYNLSEMDAPTVVKRWIDTGSIQLNYAIRNELGGGYPEGRIIEISGLPSSGKSHLAYHAAAVAQKMGGLVVYIDTENATPVQKLSDMGIDVRKRFVYCDSHCTEEVFSIIESTILKAKQVLEKNIPILVIGILSQLLHQRQNSMVNMNKTLSAFRLELSPRVCVRLPASLVRTM